MAGKIRPKKLADIMMPLAKPRMILFILSDKDLRKKKTKLLPNVVARKIMLSESIEVLTGFIIHLLKQLKTLAFF